MKILNLLLVLVLPGILRAQTVFTPISNIGQPLGSGGWAGVSGAHKFAAAFTTGNTVTSLATASISISGSSPSGSMGTLAGFALAVYGDSHGVPGNSLSLLSGNIYPTNAGNFAFTNETPLVLAANTTYWLVGSSSNTTGSSHYNWVLTSLTNLNSGSTWAQGGTGNGTAISWATNNFSHLEFSVSVTTTLPATPVVASLPTASAIVSGEALSASTLSGGTVTNAAGAVVNGSFAFTAPTTVPATGTTSQSVVFTPADGADYYAITTSVPVTATVSDTAATFISSAPTASVISYGQSLANCTLSGGTATNLSGTALAGSFTFTTPATVPAVGTTSEGVTFTPADTTDYIATTGSVPVTVSLFTFTNSGGALTITGYGGSGGGGTNSGSGPGGVVTIPDTINGLPVTVIGPNVFYRSSVTSVIISTNVTTLGTSAFAGCESLTNVTIPAGVTSIGANAFNVCNGLASVTIPDSVTNIGSGAFAECNALVDVVIPDSVTTVGQSAFDDCGSLASVTIGSGMTNLGIQVFGGFNQLASITVNPNNPAFCSVGGVLFDKGMTTLVAFPNGVGGNYSVPAGVANIGYESFGDCQYLTGVVLPDSVTNIGGYAFIECVNLTGITIPIRVNAIQEYTFAEDTSLTNVTISGGVTSLGGQASGNVVPAAGQTVRANLASLGSYVFNGCTGLHSIYFSGNAPAADTTDFQSAGSAVAYYLPGTTGWAEFTAITGVPTVPWNPQAQTSSFGVQSNRFGFNITGGTNLVVVVEACTNLANPVWQPVATNTLTGGSAAFSDPQSANFSRRYYRFVSP